MGAGGADRIRTDDPLLAKQMLSQLSYSPEARIFRSSLPSRRSLRSLVGLVGVEPTTPALSRRCSNQLSYRPAVRCPLSVGIAGSCQVSFHAARGVRPWTDF